MLLVLSLISWLVLPALNLVAIAANGEQPAGSPPKEAGSVCPHTSVKMRVHVCACVCMCVVFF